MKALNAFIKPFEAPQRSEKFNFLFQYNFLKCTGREVLKNENSVQSNLSIAETGHSKHIFVEPAVSRSNSQRTNPQYSVHLLRGHKFLEPREKFKSNLTLYSGHPIIFAGK